MSELEYFKYQSLAKLGNREVDGILDGVCHIFPKLDGTNGKIWFQDGEVKVGSRNKEIKIGDDNRGFAAWVNSDNNVAKNIRVFLTQNPTYVLFGEWLVSHTFKNYEDDAWNKFYVFDIFDTITQEHLHYSILSAFAKVNGFEFVPRMTYLENPSEEQLQNLLKFSTYLVKDGTPGEGIVIKNYSFRNQFGRTTWAKMLTDEFLQAKTGLKETKIRKVTSPIEEKIVEIGVTDSLVLKERDKLGEWQDSNVQKVMGIVFYSLLKEELPSILFKLKMPSVDFKRLKKLSDSKVREVLKL